VTGTDETWAGINNALRTGTRGPQAGSSLAQLLAEHRDVRNKANTPPLTVEQILTWVEEHKIATGDWPHLKSGLVAGTDETWAGIDAALSRGNRGLPGESTLAKLMAEHRGVRNRQDLPALTIKQILAWADEHSAATGTWPKLKSGQVTGTDETWGGINTALSQGGRGLPSGSSLPNLLTEHRGVQNHKDLPPLTLKQILTWVDEHKAATGDWPEKKSGQISGTDETWSKINSALYEGSRGLPAGSTLAKLLAEQRGVRNLKNLPPLTVNQILAWADMHEVATGHWPNQKSGPVNNTDETWAGINSALSIGRRGLPGGSSLAKLLNQRYVRHGN
jgi:hypothetical protein